MARQFESLSLGSVVLFLVATTMVPGTACAQAGGGADSVSDMKVPVTWRGFGPVEPERSAAAGGYEALATLVAPGLLKTVPDTLRLGDRRFEPKKVVLSDGRADLASVFGVQAPGNGVYLFASVKAPHDTTLTVGAGADWYMRWWLDGTVVYDTISVGNGAFPIAVTNHIFEVPLKKGTHILAVCVISGRASFAFAAGGEELIRRARAEFSLGYQAGTLKLRRFPCSSGHMTARIDFVAACADFERALAHATTPDQEAKARIALASARFADPADTDYPGIRKHYREVLELLAPVPGGPSNSGDRVTAQLGIAETWLMEEQYARAQQAIDDAVTISADPAFAGDIGCVQARLHIRKRQFDAARAVLEPLLSADTMRQAKTVREFAERMLAGMSLAQNLCSSRPRLFFNRDTWPAVKARALNEEKAAFEQLKSDVDSLRNGDILAGDWGVHLMKAAFVYRVNPDPDLLEKMKLMFRRSLDDYLYRTPSGDRARAHPRTCWLAALDWVYNDLTPTERQALITPMIRHLYMLYTEDRLRGRLSHSPWYYERNAWWYGGVALLNDELSDTDFNRVLSFLGQGYLHNVDLVRLYADRADNDGAWHLNLEYMIGELPEVIWPFFYTLRSATGMAIPDAWKDVGICVDYTLRNMIGVTDEPPELWGFRHFGYSRSWHNGGVNHRKVADHLAHFIEFHSDSHPLRAAMANHMRQRLMNETADIEHAPRFPVYPFLTANLEKAPTPAIPDGLPAARHFGKVGLVLMSSGWTNADTYALFACGGSEYTSEHFDATHFAIHRGGFLALDAGTRQGGPHSGHFWRQSVAHNCVLITMPGEELPAAVPVSGGPPVRPVNCGGQRKSPAAARVLAFETDEPYSYVASDATACYASEKCGQMVRQFLFLRPSHFVVFDRVTAAKAAYGKRWLLHTVNEPALNGNTFRADHGTGRLFCRTLAPADARLTPVGGPGNEFVAGGVNWPIWEGWGYWRQHGHEIPDAAGRWRVEVSPRGTRRSDYFLHVLQTCSRDCQEMSETGVTESGDTIQLTLEEENRRVCLTFNKTGDVGGTVRIVRDGKTVVDRALKREVFDQAGLALPGRASVVQAPESVVLPDSPRFRPQRPVRVPERSIPDRIAAAALIARLGDDAWETRRAAVRRLGERADPAAIPHLTKCVHDPDWRVRRMAVWALGQAGAAGVPHLVSLLSGEDLELAGHAARALTAVGGPAADRLAELTAPERAAACPRAVAVLGRIAPARFAENFIALLEAGSPEVRSHAAAALGGAADAGAGAALLRALADSHPDVRRAAAEALGTLGLRAAVSPLIRALQDPDGQVRTAAAAALGNLRSREAVDHLIAALADPERRVAATAHTALTRITGHHVSVGLTWPAEYFKTYRQPLWQTWWEKNRDRNGNE